MDRAHKERERALLGAVLCDPRAARMVTGEITDADFSVAQHRTIFAAVARMIRGDRVVDRDAVVQELERRGELHDVGGAGAIDDLVRDRPELRAAVTAVAEARAMIPVVWREPVVAMAATVLGATAVAPQHELEIRHAVAVERHGLHEEPGPGDRDDLLSSGYPELDELTGGLRRGELILVAAAPAMGATSFAVNVLRNVALGRLGVAGTGHGVAFFSLDFTARQIGDRLLCSLARVSQAWVGSDQRTDEQHARLAAAAEILATATIHLDETPGLDMTKLRDRAIRLRAEDGIELVVVDDLDRLARRDPDRARHEAAGYVAEGLKALAKELEIPVLLLGKLMREPIEDRPGHRPELLDLQHGDAIVEAADVVLLLHRADYYMSAEEAENMGKSGMAQVFVATVKTGRTGTVELQYDRRVGSFG